MRKRTVESRLDKLMTAVGGQTMLPHVWRYQLGETAQDAAQRAKQFGVTNILAVPTLSEREWLAQAARHFELNEVSDATEKE